MILFSQKKGIKPIKSVIQIDSMDSDLRNGLWNALIIFYWKQSQSKKRDYHYPEPIDKLVIILWLDYFKKPIDTLDDYWPYTYEKIRNYFFNCEWYEVYDFIEFIANNYPEKQTNQKFMDFCNSILEQELSAYRFVGGRITQITSEIEISQIEEALEITSSVKAVNIHLKSALDLLSNRKSPDYRNSIKESISAVESICKLIVKDENATLSEALKKIEDKLPLHSALKKAFDSLYGYTSNAEGIRHALLDEPNLSFEDAKFMLVSCSAFINYLISRAQKAGIKM